MEASGVSNQAGARLRQKRKFSVYAEVRASETSALRALKWCKKIIALGVEALRQREKTVTFEETGRAERDKSFFHHIRIKQARGQVAARKFSTFNIQNSTSNIRNPLILERLL